LYAAAVKVTIQLAERELNDGARSYELEQAGLGTAFITEVLRCNKAPLR
jgi:hypothetical protein